MASGTTNRAHGQVQHGPPSGQAGTFGIAATGSGGFVKAKIKARGGTLADEQLLVFAGQQHEAGNTISDCSIKRESTLHHMVHHRGEGNSREHHNCL